MMELCSIADLSTSDSLQSVLFTAVLAEKIGEAKFVLEASLNASELVNERDAFGNTALMLACKKGNANSAKMLIESGALIELKNWKGRDALYYALKRRSLACIELLFGGLSSDSKAIILREHLLPLTGLEGDVRESFDILAVKATRLGFIHILDYLLQSFDINEIIDTSGATGENKILRMDGKTLIHIACEADCLESLKLLRQKGADIDKKDAYGNDLFSKVRSKPLLEFLIRSLF
jgi:ankyrin repeat protein